MLKQFMRYKRTRRRDSQSCESKSENVIEPEDAIQNAIQFAIQMANNAAKYARDITQHNKLPLQYTENTLALSKVCGRYRQFIRFNNGIIYWK